MSHVGTLREGPLHASLKTWLTREGDLVEHAVDGFVIDLVRGDELIEVQTGNFSSMRRKLEALLPSYRVRIVYPVAALRWIVKVGEGGEVMSRRRSPRRGSVLDLFSELVSFPALMTDPHLILEVVVTHQDEIRRHHPGRAWRRRGWVTEERHLLEVVERHTFDTTGSLVSLLPEELGKTFTTADMATGLGCPRRLAQQMAFCLREAGAIADCGRSGNARIYRIVTP